MGERLRRDIRSATGLTGSVGLAGAKMLAKIASEAAKPDGLVVIEPGTERELLGPMTVRTLPGVGPATAETLRRAGIHTVAETAEAGEAELVRLLGKAHGAGLYAMALGRDDRPVVAERDAKSISVEDTFEVDLTDRTRVRREVLRLADRCVQRLRAAGRSGRTVVIKVRSYDFSTLTRSETLRGPTDDPAVIREAAARLLETVDTTGGVRLLGVGVSGLADFTQEDLFAQVATEREAEETAKAAAGTAADRGGTSRTGPRRSGRGAGSRGWTCVHDEYGAGWVQGSGVGEGDRPLRNAVVRTGKGADLCCRGPGAAAGGAPAAGARGTDRVGQSSEPAILPKFLSPEPGEDTGSEVGEEISSR